MKGWHAQAAYRFDAALCRDGGGSQSRRRPLELWRSDDILFCMLDYPHWQFDSNAVVPPGFSPALRRKIAIDNPLATYARLREDAR